MVIPFTTTQLRINFLQEHGGLPTILTIDNQDVTNPLTYKVDYNSSLLISGPANALIEIDNIIESGFIEINPNAGTGGGVVSCDVSPVAELEILGMIPQSLIK